MCQPCSASLAWPTPRHYIWVLIYICLPQQHSNQIMGRPHSLLVLYTMEPHVRIVLLRVFAVTNSNIRAHVCWDSTLDLWQTSRTSGIEMGAEYQAGLNCAGLGCTIQQKDMPPNLPHGGLSSPLQPHPTSNDGALIIPRYGQEGAYVNIRLTGRHHLSIASKITASPKTNTPIVPYNVAP